MKPGLIPVVNFDSLNEMCYLITQITFVHGKTSQLFFQSSNLVLYYQNERE